MDFSLKYSAFQPFSNIVTLLYNVFWSLKEKVNMVGKNNEIWTNESGCQVLRFGGRHTFWRWQNFRVYYMFKVSFSGHNPIWGSTKVFGGELPPNAPPWLRAWVKVRKCGLHFLISLWKSLVKPKHLRVLSLGSSCYGLGLFDKVSVSEVTVSNASLWRNVEIISNVHQVLENITEGCTIRKRCTGLTCFLIAFVYWNG